MILPVAPASISGHAKNQSCFHLFSDQLMKIPANGNYGNDPEYGKHRLPQLAGNIEAKGHARVFDEPDLKPVAKYGNTFSNGHGCFNLELDDLINNKYQDDKR